MSCASTADDARCWITIPSSVLSSSTALKSSSSTSRSPRPWLRVCEVRIPPTIEYSPKASPEWDTASVMAISCSRWSGASLCSGSTVMPIGLIRQTGKRIFSKASAIGPLVILTDSDAKAEFDEPVQFRARMRY
jgi:hypothetical protein